jgi:hypothetical protein
LGLHPIRILAIEILVETLLLIKVLRGMNFKGDLVILRKVPMRALKVSTIITVGISDSVGHIARITMDIGHIIGTTTIIGVSMLQEVTLIALILV